MSLAPNSSPSHKNSGRSSSPVVGGSGSASAHEGQQRKRGRPQGSPKSKAKAKTTPTKLQRKKSPLQQSDFEAVDDAKEHKLVAGSAKVGDNQICACCQASSQDLGGLAKSRILCLVSCVFVMLGECPSVRMCNVRASACDDGCLRMCLSDSRWARLPALIALELGIMVLFTIQLSDSARFYSQSAMPCSA